jgi:hypothetical protein
MSPMAAPPAARNRWTWLDLTAAACVVSLAVALVIPAVQQSRLNARGNVCQENFHHVGEGLAQIEQQQPGTASRYLPGRSMQPGSADLVDLRSSWSRAPIVNASLFVSGDPARNRVSRPASLQTAPQASLAAVAGHPAVRSSGPGQFVLLRDGQVAFVSSRPTGNASVVRAAAKEATAFVSQASDEWAIPATTADSRP